MSEPMQQYPYKVGQMIWVKYTSRPGAKQIAKVVEDCGHKYSFGSAKWDYVRVKKFRRRSNRWTSTVQVAREDIIGLAEEQI